jgi:hypothetical protein
VSEESAALDVDHLMAADLSSLDEDTALQGIAMLIDEAADFGRACPSSDALRHLPPQR